jgi:hypothetical protein
MPAQHAGDRNGRHFSYGEVSRSLTLLWEPPAGTVHTFPGTVGHLPAWFPQRKCMTRPLGLGAILT